MIHQLVSRSEPQVRARPRARLQSTEALATAVSVSDGGEAEGGVWPCANATANRRRVTWLNSIRPTALAPPSSGESCSCRCCCAREQLLLMKTAAASAASAQPEAQKSSCLYFPPLILFSFFPSVPSMCQARECARVNAVDALLRTPGRDARN